MKVKSKPRTTFIIVLWEALVIVLFPTAPEAFSFSDSIFFSRDETKFPPNPYGQKAREFWDSFSQKDLAKLEKFFSTCLPEEKLAEISAVERAIKLINLREKLGEVALAKVETRRPEEIIITFSSTPDSFWQLGLNFNLIGGKLILVAMIIEETGQDALLPPLPALDLDQALQKLDGEISLATAEDRFSGVVLIAKDFNPIFFKAYGLASREFDVPNRLNTKFNLGSINKIFTKVAIAHLVEKGLLSLGTKLGSILPNYPNPEAREKVTVKNLVAMTAGIGDFFGPDFQKTPKEFLRHNRDYLPLFASKPLAFEPGTKQLYSNGSYVVLGEIIAKVSGMDYYEYIQKNIFDVAGMKESAWYEADELVSNLAEGYTREKAGWKDGQPSRQKKLDEENSFLEKETPREKKMDEAKMAGEQQAMVKDENRKISWRRNIYTRPARGSAAGGGYATAQDLLRFIRALDEGKLLSLVFTDWVFGGPEPRPGQVRNQEAVNRENWNLGLAGGAPGINASLEFEARSGWTVIVLANLDPPAATDISRLVKRYLRAVIN